jgi:hypothetical protein
MDFSDVRASFFAGLSTTNVRRTPEKNNGILGSPFIFYVLTNSLDISWPMPQFQISRTGLQRFLTDYGGGE